MSYRKSWCVHRHNGSHHSRGQVANLAVTNIRQRDLALDATSDGVDVVVENQHDDEIELMRSLGLPASFGGNKAGRPAKPRKNQRAEESDLLGVVAGDVDPWSGARVGGMARREARPPQVTEAELLAAVMQDLHRDSQLEQETRAARHTDKARRKKRRKKSKKAKTTEEGDGEVEGDQDEVDADAEEWLHKEPTHKRFDEEDAVAEAEPEARNPYGRSNQKYWAQRYRLFSRYDEGIWLDRGMYERLMVSLGV